MKLSLPFRRKVEHPPVQVTGTTRPGYDLIRQAFEENFRQGREVGASLAVMHRGELVVDICAGHREAERRQPWTSDTLVNVWSTTKGLVALVFGMLVQRGFLRYEDPVSKHWPEFAANGKSDITIDQLLSHQAGLCGPTEKTSVEDLYDQDLMARRLAAQAPLWPPGSVAGYHAMSFGVMTAELVRRVTGLTLGAWFRREVAVPQGIDGFIGLPESEESRVARIVSDGKPFPVPLAMLSKAQRAAIANPQRPLELPNQRAWRAAELPALNGQCSAVGLARAYASLAGGGGTLVDPGIIANMRRVRFDGTDEVTRLRTRWGAGFMLNVDGLYGPNAGSFGHPGRGGSIAFADPESQLSFAYTPNNLLGPGVEDRRAPELIAALYRSPGLLEGAHGHA